MFGRGLQCGIVADGPDGEVAGIHALGECNIFCTFSGFSIGFTYSAVGEAPEKPLAGSGTGNIRSVLAFLLAGTLLLLKGRLPGAAAFSPLRLFGSRYQLYAPP